MYINLSIQSVHDIPDIIYKAIKDSFILKMVSVVLFFVYFNFFDNTLAHSFAMRLIFTMLFLCLWWVDTLIIRASALLKWVYKKYWSMSDEKIKNLKVNYNNLDHNIGWTRCALSPAVGFFYGPFVVVVIKDFFI